MTGRSAIQLVRKETQGKRLKGTLWLDMWRQFRRHRMATAGLAIFISFFVVAVLGVVLTTGPEPLLNPSLVRLPEKLRPPMAAPRAELLQPGDLPVLGIYVLGTDDLGRDVFARMMQGAWVSLTVGFVAVGIAVGIGILLGGISGYYGPVPVMLGHMLAVIGLGGGAIGALAGHSALALGLAAMGAASLGLLARTGRWKGNRAQPLARWLALPCFSVDTLVMRLVDIMLCFPSFFLILTVVALLPASIYNIMVVIGLTSWMGTTRLVRAEFLALREQDFVAAAQALGVPARRIIFRHLIPNAIAPVLVSATLGIGGAIMTEAALSFLGFGVPPPHATWGNIFSDGKRFIFDAPWLTFLPGIAVLVVVLAFNLFGEGLRDVLNPRLRERRSV